MRLKIKICREDDDSSLSDREWRISCGAEHGIGFGACLAMIISWHRNQSVLWAIIHGILGWLYVLWYVIWGRH
ncbi:MAG: hypothetical protein KatS3mg019_2474 [Fimbriimonadales bacterium]|nr:MAG: hypothetical protein KatS3mg019_2474 [Fimbriimonadales bacterium]